MVQNQLSELQIINRARANANVSAVSEVAGDDAHEYLTHKIYLLQNIAPAFAIQELTLQTANVDDGSYTVPADYIIPLNPKLCDRIGDRIIPKSHSPDTLRYIANITKTGDFEVQFVDILIESLSIRYKGLFRRAESDKTAIAESAMMLERKIASYKLANMIGQPMQFIRSR